MTEELTDQQWLEKVWQGYSAAIARTMASYEYDQALQEDLIQDVYLALHQSVSSFRQAKYQKAYTLKVAHNVATDHIARRYRDTHLHYSVDGLSELVADESSQEVNQVSRDLLKAIRKLKLPYRQVVTLLLEDLSHKEIANILSISNMNVRVRAKRAKAELKRLLSE